MEIRYLGHSSFLIKAKTARIVTDPFDPKMVGLKFPKTEADIVTISHHHHDHDYVAGVGGNPLILDWPGEFEKMDVRIFGYQSFHDKQGGQERGEVVIYKIETEGLSVLHAGDLGMIPDDDFIESLGDVDILMLPVGGFYTIDASEGAKLARKIEPSIIIPMHFSTPGLSPDLAGKLAPVGDFMKEMNGESFTPQDKLVIKKEDLAEEGMKVIVLTN
ncbi:hypothetical protein A3F03_04460 [Candidatus Roizmanbacteria bacterium RIFCSPHIGHO2_12_FULL_41_11]|uniref:Lactamase n=2 Tax=Candidatus Roizmaniibacteriota TaxID=1752723 RepID=A0A1F7J747_9BACT|nr:MAG: hypothetical protein A3F03_04460 [Candidatus Roizmanbacteria bacterium RIFCSPHIGHO2_12_FULL_41_11]OGK51424.1 MAG: hypothetical protein A2966_03080 [Candidatus Roizmanbacteria bacterium RIFCSPLOWO2_01_FULL_41_22]